MKLDRNIPGNNGRGKYALIKLRTSCLDRERVNEAIRSRKNVQIDPEAIDFGDTSDTEFFVVRLKDKYAPAALFAYAEAASEDDEEYANEVHDLADKAIQHPSKRRPD